MSSPIWNHLCQQPPTLIATFTEKHAKIVHDSTTQLHQSLDSILSTLNRRAIALTKLANFESALRDADLMQQLSPSSALGYICAATIYSDQGKQRHVIDVCNKGLSMIDKQDPDYATLQHAKEVAMQREDNRIDFVSQLPADMVISILIPLYMGDHGMRACMPGPYLYVCNTWRNRFIESLGGLRFMIGFDTKDECSEVAQFARYAKDLYIAEYSEGSWLSDLLRGHDFCSLRYLRIYRFANSEDIHFMPTLKSISNTLTSLSITLDTKDDALPIADIMLTCSNLTSLEIIGSRTVDVSSLPMEPRSTITALSVTYSKRSIRGDQVIGILKRFPSLKKLVLSPCADLQSAFVITEYCPLLQHVEIRMGHDPLGPQLLYTCFGQSCASQGITGLSVRGHLGPAYDVDEFTSLLDQYSHTLERIDWDITSDENDAMHNIQYPRLTKLDLNTDGWWIAHNAPTLQEMKITGDAINLNPAVLDPIPSTLTTLTMDLFK